jgi:DNA polymerase epsilon subunit 1
VTDEDCAACVFNRPGKTCLRQMQWVWRGETFACDSREYYTIKNQLASEPLPPETEGGPHRAFDQLPYDERQKLLKDRLKLYTQKVCPVIGPHLVL